MKKVALGLIFVLGLAIRLYKIDRPLADWHSWRQADTASVARNFIKNGFDLLHPRFDDLSNVPSGFENPQGYRMVEFPVYNAVHGGIYLLINKLGFKVAVATAGRITSIIFSLVSAWLLYLIVKKETNEWLGILTTALFLFLPYNIYYSTTILPGPAMVAFSLGSIYFLYKDQKKLIRVSLLFSLILGAIAVLTKPYAVFLLFPSYFLFFWKTFFKEEKKSKVFGVSLISALVIILPFLLWRQWIKQFPEGIPVNQWLLNEGGLRFRPAWWRWLFAERLAKLVLGYWGTTFLAIGLITKSKKPHNEPLFWGWLIGIFSYLVIFARGNIQHDYYQIVTVPAISFFLGKGFLFLWQAPQKYFSPLITKLTILIMIAFSFGFGWYQIRDYYQIRHPEIVEAGKRVDEILPEDAKVIAHYGGDTAFLYQTNRSGWPVMLYSQERREELGATHFVSVNYDSETNQLINECKVIEKTDKWIIIDLRECQEEK